MIKRLLHSQLRINMASGVATTAVNTVVMAVGYPVYLHFLGYEQYGVWLVLATVLTFAQLGNLGIGPAVMKLVAEEHGRHDIPGIQRYVTTAIALLCVTGTIILAAILLFRRQIIGLFALTDANARTALWLLPYIGILSIYVFVVQVFEATLSGLGRMDLANYRGTLARVTNLSASSLLLSLGFGVGSLLAGRIAAEVVTHLAMFVAFRRLFGLRLLRRDGLNATRGKRLLSYGVAVSGDTLLSSLFGPFNKLILSRYVGVASIPIYEIALTGSLQIKSLVTAGHRALVPEISRIGAETTARAKARMSELYRQSLKLVLCLATPVFAGLALFAPALLKLWLGDRFVEALPGAVRIMLLGAFLSVLGIPAYYMLMGTGRVYRNLVSQLVQTGANVLVILAVGVLSSISISGVVWASAVAMTAAMLYLLWHYKRSVIPLSARESAQDGFCPCPYTTAC